MVDAGNNYVGSLRYNGVHGEFHAINGSAVDGIDFGMVVGRAAIYSQRCFNGNC